MCAGLSDLPAHFRRRTVEKLLRELAGNGLILLYTVEGKPYLEVLRWRERVRTSKSKYPCPPSDGNDANRGQCVTAPLKVTYREPREADKQSVSEEPLLTGARPDANNCLPPTPKALEPTPKPPPRAAGAGGGGGFYKPGRF